MVNKHEPGEVYFSHTMDQVSGESHGYYKIGIVRNERDSEQRIKEHLIRCSESRSFRTIPIL